MKPNSGPRDRFVRPYLTLMIDSFSCTHFCANAWGNTKLLLTKSILRKMAVNRECYIRLLTDDTCACNLAVERDNRPT